MSALAITPPGGAELIIILIVLVLLFGAKKLPELGSAVGKSIKNFKKGIEESKDEVPDVADHDQVSENSTRKTENSTRKTET